MKGSQRKLLVQATDVPASRDEAGREQELALVLVVLLVTADRDGFGQDLALDLEKNGHRGGPAN